MLAGFDTKDAWALCTFAYSAGPGTDPILFEGRTNGRIVPARGTSHFGWDAVFEAEDTGKTYGFCYSLQERALMGKSSYAEMTTEEKNGLSHRYKALAKLKEYLVTVDH